MERGPVYTVRVALDEVRPRSIQLAKMLAAMGCSFEGMDAAWFVVSAHEEAAFAALVDQLAASGYRWEYVNPKREDIASPHPSAATSRLVPPDIDVSKQALLHLDAPWRDRADDELEVLAVVDETKKRAELLPARRVDEVVWELCCSPFLADGLALGDIVAADASFRILRRITRSGRAAIVAVVEEDDVDSVRASLAQLGCVVERRRKTGVLAVDCETPAIFERAHAWMARNREIVTFEVLEGPRRPAETSGN